MPASFPGLRQTKRRWRGGAQHPDGEAVAARGLSTLRSANRVVKLVPVVRSGWRERGGVGGGSHHAFKDRIERLLDPQLPRLTTLPHVDDAEHALFVIEARRV